MKTIVPVLTLAGIVALTIAGLAGADPKARPALPSPTRELMQQKLEHSQQVLEGIAKEDYGLILQNARKLRVISEQPAWPFIDNPEYTRQVATFRQNVEALLKAADERKLDAAARAYTKVTLSCVECHKFARGQKAASLDHQVQRALPKRTRTFTTRHGGAYESCN